jgi:hypothetical protein
MFRHVVKHFGGQERCALEALLELAMLAFSYQPSTLCTIHDRVDSSAIHSQRARDRLTVNGAQPLHVQIGSRASRLLLTIMLSVRLRF